MLIEDVAKLTPTEIFLYWCKERQEIYNRRKAGMPKPWTDDVILQRNYFTNVYREQDKTTAWFRENVRGPMAEDPRVIFATACFRWFNLIETGELLLEHDLLKNWQPEAAIQILGDRRNRGIKIFTGAFMINSPPGEPKLEAIVKRITNVWDARNSFPRTWPTLQNAHRALTRFPGMGGFMAYEVVTDLRWTSVLRDATDIMDWSNPGPGAVRGLYRVLGRPLGIVGNSSAPATPRDWKERTKELLDLCLATPMPPSEYPFEMHEIEMSLCETDKSIRLLRGEGKSKRNYAGAI